MVLGKGRHLTAIYGTVPSLSLSLSLSLNYVCRKDYGYVEKTFLPLIIEHWECSHHPLEKSGYSYYTDWDPLQSTAVTDAWARRAAGPTCSDDVTLQSTAEELIPVNEERNRSKKGVAARGRMAPPPASPWSSRSWTAPSAMNPCGLQYFRCIRCAPKAITSFLLSFVAVSFG